MQNCVNTARVLRNAVLLTLLFFGSSCSTARLAQPELTLVDINFGEVTLLETTLHAKVRLDNENPEPLEINGAVHRISLNGIDVGKGISDENVRIPRLGSATQHIKVRVDNLSLLMKVQRLIEARDFNYRIDSTLYLPGSFGRRSVRVSKEGQFGLPESRRHSGTERYGERDYL